MTRMSRRTPTLLDLLSRDLGVCKVSMKPNPWVVSWSGGQQGCITMRRVQIPGGRAGARRGCRDTGGDTAPADQVRQALSTALDIIVERWHQWEDDGRTLAEFMELTDEQYAMFAEKGPEGYIAAVAQGDNEEEKVE